MCVVFNTPCEACLLSNSISLSRNCFFSSRNCFFSSLAQVSFAHHAVYPFSPSSIGFSFKCSTSFSTFSSLSPTFAISDSVHNENAGKEAVKHTETPCFLKQKGTHTLSLTEHLHGGLEGFPCEQTRKGCEGNEK